MGGKLPIDFTSYPCDNQLCKSTHTMEEKRRELRRALSKLGYCSRKEAEHIIQEGRVTIAGKATTNFLQPVYLSDDIRIDGKKIKKKQLEIFAFNKPRGVITTMDIYEKRPKVADFMPKHTYLFPIGRLDKNSRGLLLFTNDNDFGNRILAPATKLEKVYRVQVKGRFLEKHIKELERGIFIERIRHTAKQVRVVKTNPRSAWLEITLIEGKNRQIRKMLETLGYEILELVRVRIGKLKLRPLNLQPGEYRNVRQSEVE